MSGRDDRNDEELQAAPHSPLDVTRSRGVLTHEKLHSLRRVVSQMLIALRGNNRCDPTYSVETAAPSASTPFLSGDGSLRIPQSSSIPPGTHTKHGLVDSMQTRGGRSSKLDAIVPLLQSTILSDIADVACRKRPTGVNLCPLADYEIQAHATVAWLEVVQGLMRISTSHSTPPNELRSFLGSQGLRVADVVDSACHFLKECLLRLSDDATATLAQRQSLAGCISHLSQALSLCCESADVSSSADDSLDSWTSYVVTAWCDCDLMSSVWNVLKTSFLLSVSDQSTDVRGSGYPENESVLSVLLQLVRTLVSCLSSRRRVVSTDLLLCIVSPLTKCITEGDDLAAHGLGHGDHDTFKAAMSFASLLHAFYNRPQSLLRSATAMGDMQHHANLLHITTSLLLLTASNPPRMVDDAGEVDTWICVLEDIVCSLSSGLAVASRKVARCPSPNAGPSDVPLMEPSPHLPVGVDGLRQSNPLCMEEAVLLLLVIHVLPRDAISSCSGAIFCHRKGPADSAGTPALCFKNYSCSSCVKNSLTPFLFSAAVSALHGLLHQVQANEGTNRAVGGELHITDGVLLNCVSVAHPLVAEVPPGSTVTFLSNTLLVSQGNVGGERLLIPDECLQDAHATSPCVPTEVATILRQHAYATHRYRALPSWVVSLKINAQTSAESAGTGFEPKSNRPHPFHAAAALSYDTINGTPITLVTKTSVPQLTPEQSSPGRQQQLTPQLPLVHLRHAPFSDTAPVTETHILNVPQHCGPAVLPLDAVEATLSMLPTSKGTGLCSSSALELYALKPRSSASERKEGESGADASTDAVAVSSDRRSSQFVRLGLCAIGVTPAAGSDEVQIAVWSPTHQDGNHQLRLLFTNLRSAADKDRGRSCSSQSKGVPKDASPGMATNDENLPDDPTPPVEVAGDPDPLMSRCPPGTCMPAEERRHLQDIVGRQQRRIVELETQLSTSEIQRESLMEHVSKMRSEIDIYQDAMVQPLRDETSRLRKTLMDRETELQLALAALHTVVGQNDALARHLETIKAQLTRLPC